MGFFSYECAKCAKSVLAPTMGYKSFSEATLFFPDGRQASGTYDGYGGIDGDYDCEDMDEVQDLLQDGREVKLVHTGCVEAQDSFKSLPLSGHCAKQGYFFTEEDLTRVFGPPEKELA